MCIFCKIINREIPAEIIYEDENVIAFKDIEPKAPVHFLVVPKKHIESALEINKENSGAVASCFEAISKIAKKLNLEKGFRVINNCGVDGGQTVMHLHFHVLGGLKLTEKMI